MPQVVEQQIADLTSVLGDPTRRAIYIAARESSEPLTVGKVAELFGIHRNLARHHLEKLTEEGYLQVGSQPPSVTRRAGRPPKHYESTSRHIEITYPTLRYDLLVELLTKIVSRVSPDHLSEVAEEVGREYGLELADEIGTASDAGYREAVQGDQPDIRHREADQHAKRDITRARDDGAGDGGSHQNLKGLNHQHRAECGRRALAAAHNQPQLALFDRSRQQGGE